MTYPCKGNPDSEDYNREEDEANGIYRPMHNVEFLWETFIGIALITIGICLFASDIYFPRFIPSEILVTVGLLLIIIGYLTISGGI